jgi:geranylgeranyl reductase family protein
MHGEKKFDVIVVGAGTAGCLVSRTVANAGYEVCLIDRKKKEDIGEKVCGDAIGKHHFDNLEIEYPSGEELICKIDGGKLYSPDTKNNFLIKGAGLPGFIVDRKLFGQRLLRNSINAGSTLYDSVQVLKPLIAKGFVNGVLAKNLRTQKNLKLFTKVTIDASGISAVIRRMLPSKFGIDKTIDKEDIVVCYREIRELKEEIMDPNYIELYFNQRIAPGGYYWVFPSEKKRVNVGLGVGIIEGFPNPKKQLYNYVLSKPLFKNSSILKGGGGQVPTRNPLSCIAGNGVLLIGDSACQVNPIHGGGIGPSMLSGVIAGETIINAIGEGNLSQEGLWPYNVKYMKLYGVKQAGLNIFRLFLQGLSNEDLNYGMKYNLIKEDDILRASMDGEVRLNITEKTRRVFMGLRKLSLLKKLADLVSIMREVKKLHQKYPLSPKGLNEWKNSLQHLMKRAKLTIKSG